ncbi:MAG: aspartyl beta-hydroxylase [Nevskia sp.]|nr:aspartyl beta-hydroxylase [Nevskia sp.]
MLDLPNVPELDKARLIGGCIRLPLNVDHTRLRAEIAQLPGSLWGSKGGRVGVHNQAEAIFLRGYAPAEGERPIEERPVLARLPEVRRLITQVISAEPMRCLLARLAPGGRVPVHIDGAKYFSKTLRLHFPIETNASVAMWCSGLSYRMRVGEAWALNNSAVHGVYNADPVNPRTHLICDFLPSTSLLQLLADGEPALGVANPELEAYLLGRADAGA